MGPWLVCPLWTASIIIKLPCLCATDHMVGQRQLEFPEKVVDVKHMVFITIYSPSRSLLQVQSNGHDRLHFARQGSRCTRVS